MSTWIQRLALPLLFGLAVAFVLAGAWDLRHQGHGVHYSPAQVLAPDTDTTSWADIILEKNILGLEIPDRVGPVPMPDQENEPASWHHLGTLTGKTPKVLLREDGQVLILDQGDVFKGWKLDEVQQRTVIWVAGDRLQEVRLWTKAPEIDPSASFRAPPPQSWETSTTGSRVAFSRQEIQPLLADPNSLLQMANFKPFTVDGAVNGFQVLSIRPDSLLYKVGLRNGDVLARINGQALTGPTQLLQAYAGMDRASLVTLDVQRASQMLTYLVEIN